VTEDARTIQEFQEEPSVTPLPFGNQVVGRILLTMLSIVLFGVLLGGLSLLMVRLRAAPPPKGNVVVASIDLKPYQRIRAGDVALDQVRTSVDGTVLTDTASLVDQAITLQAIDEGEAVPAESVVVFPTTVDLNNTVILAIPLLAEQSLVSALEPGLPVLAIGSMVSETASSSVYSAVVPLAQVTGTQAIVVVRPEIAAQLSLYLPPWGKVILAPTTDR
jgi:hypothetical protein